MMEVINQNSRFGQSVTVIPTSKTSEKKFENYLTEILV